MKGNYLNRFLLLLICFYGGTVMAFTLTTNAFQPNQFIPAKYTCDSKQTIPTLSWSDAPVGTQSFALIMDDPDTPMGLWIHWVLYNIPVTVNQLPTTAPGITQGKNSPGTLGYHGPCPPKGANAHRYYFTLYALDSNLDLPEGATAAEVRAAAKPHLLQQVQLMGKYQRSE